MMEFVEHFLFLTRNIDVQRGKWYPDCARLTGKPDYTPNSYAEARFVVTYPAVNYRVVLGWSTRKLSRRRSGKFWPDQDNGPIGGIDRIGRAVEWVFDRAR